MLLKHGRGLWNFATNLYFVGSRGGGQLTEAAREEAHTSQPSLSRRILSLSDTYLCDRNRPPRLGVSGGSRTPDAYRSGVVPTRGRAFLDHARLALAQVEAGTGGSAAARRSRSTGVAVGFRREWKSTGSLQ